MSALKDANPHSNIVWYQFYFKSSLFPALRLPKHKIYDVVLLDLTTYNSILNIIESVNNKLYYCITDKEKRHLIVNKVDFKTRAY